MSNLVFVPNPLFYSPQKIHLISNMFFTKQTPMVEALTATIRSDTASSIRLLENLTVQKLRLLTQLALARQMYPQISRQHRTPYAYTHCEINEPTHSADAA